MPPLTKALVDAGALGTIQSATPPAQPNQTMAGQSQPAINILDGFVPSWDKLPALPDIKLLNTQYDEIKDRIRETLAVQEGAKKKDFQKEMQTFAKNAEQDVHDHGVVRASDPSKTMADLDDHKIVFGPVAKEERRAWALETLTQSGITPVPPLKEASSCP
jgi:hypothetical protein